MIDKQLTILPYSASNSLLWDRRVKGSPSRVEHFMQSSKRVRQAMGLYHGKPCLSCQATRHCESKFRNHDTLFKMQDKWRNVIANHHRTMDK